MSMNISAMQASRVWIVIWAKTCGNCSNSAPKCIVIGVRGFSEEVECFILPSLSGSWFAQMRFGSRGSGVRIPLPRPVFMEFWRKSEVKERP